MWMKDSWLQGILAFTDDARRLVGVIAVELWFAQAKRCAIADSQRRS